MNELYHYYLKFCSYFHRKGLMLVFDIEGEDLIVAFSKLLQVEETSFGPNDSCPYLILLLTLNSFNSVR